MSVLTVRTSVAFESPVLVLGGLLPDYGLSAPGYGPSSTHGVVLPLRVPAPTTLPLPPLICFDSRAAHARTLLPEALVSVSSG